MIARWMKLSLQSLPAKLCKIGMQKRLQKGREVTEQLRAEKMRVKKEKAKGYERGTFRYGLANRQSIIDFMRDVKERREQKQKIK